MQFQWYHPATEALGLHAEAKAPLKWTAPPRPHRSQPPSSKPALIAALKLPRLRIEKVFATTKDKLEENSCPSWTN
jgi:hypothetical protein